MPHQPEYSSKIQHLFDKVNIYGDVSSFFESISDVPHPLLLLYAAHFCLSELDNGGFLQLFWNSTGVLVPEAVEGYTAIGMPKLAAIFCLCCCASWITLPSRQASAVGRAPESFLAHRR